MTPTSEPATCVHGYTYPCGLCLIPALDDPAPEDDGEGGEA